jgi:hypothetical protein
MTDSEAPRPHAQYGEYATPEQQQAARGLPEPTGDIPIADASPPAMPAPAHQPQAAAAPALRAHPVDRVVTLILLALGLFVLLTGIPGYLALSDALQLVYDQLGAGTYPATETAAALGVTALVVQAVIWVATAASAWFAMKRGRIAWWICVVGAALSFIASMVVVSIALFADPGFMDSVSAQTLP